jgi:Arc/MetJ-type ribon-helix-helix transcriptional regulator
MNAKVTGMEVVTLRLPRPLVERVDALVERLGKDEEWALRGFDTRAQVMREALIQGLKLLEEGSKKR